MQTFGRLLEAILGAIQTAGIRCPQDPLSIERDLRDNLLDRHHFEERLFSLAERKGLVRTHLKEGLPDNTKCTHNRRINVEGDHALGHTHSSNSANTAILVITGLVSHELALPKHIPFASPFEREGIMLCMVGGLNNFPNTKGHFRAVLKQQLWRAFLPVLCIRRH